MEIKNIKGFKDFVPTKPAKGYYLLAFGERGRLLSSLSVSKKFKNRPDVLSRALELFGNQIKEKLK